MTAWQYSGSNPILCQRNVVQGLQIALQCQRGQESKAIRHPVQGFSVQKILKIRPLRPTRSCEKKIGPGELR